MKYIFLIPLNIPYLLESSGQKLNFIFSKAGTLGSFGKTFRHALIEANRYDTIRSISRGWRHVTSLFRGDLNCAVSTGEQVRRRARAAN